MGQSQGRFYQTQSCEVLNCGRKFILEGPNRNTIEFPYGRRDIGYYQ